MAQPKKFSLTQFLSVSRTFWAGFLVCAVGLTIYGIFVNLMQLLQVTPVPCPVALPTYAFVEGVKAPMPSVPFPAQTDLVPAGYTLAIKLATSGETIIWPRFGEGFADPDNGMGVVNVYQLRPLNYTLVADQAARDIARNLGFSAIPKILDSRTVLFTKEGRVLTEDLQIDLKTMFLTLKTNALSTSNYFGTLDYDGVRRVPDRYAAVKATLDYLRAAGILPADITDSGNSAAYYKAVGASLEPVESLLEADFVEVPFARNPLAGIVNRAPGPGRCETEAVNYYFYGPRGFGSIRSLVGRDINDLDIVIELEDYYYSIDYSQVATYPIKSTSDAWQALLANKAYVVNPRGVQNAVITSVELGYFEAHTEQEYLLPIFVFRGENDFMAYVEALHPQVISTR